MDVPRRRYYPAMAVVMIGLLSSFQVVVSQQKLAVDVKTRVFIKSELAPIKQGVIMAIDASNWAYVKETGEQWALWIEEPTRLFFGKDSIRLRVRLELRKPSAIMKGTLLRQLLFERRYALHDTNTDIAFFAKAFSEKQQEWNQLLNAVDTVAAVAKKTPNPKAAAIGGVAGWLVSQVRKKMTNPSRQELLEGSLICFAVMPAVYQLCNGAPVPAKRTVKPWGSN